MSVRYRYAGFAICIDNEGYPVSLELRKVYRVLRDPDADEVGCIRVIDESREDYLYPAKRFASVELPRKARATFGSRRSGSL